MRSLIAWKRQEPFLSRTERQENVLRVLNFNEAAQRGSFTRRTLERLIANGEGPSVIHISARRRGILETDWENWLLSRRRKAPGDLATAEKGAA